MAYAETSRKKQNRNSNSTSPRSALEKPFSNLTLYPGDSSKDGKSLVQRERSPVAGNRYSRYSGSLSATSAKPKASAAQKSPNLNTRGGRSTQRQVADKQPNPQKSVVPKAKGMLAPKGYTMRPIIPAAKAELLPVARAMHGDDFAPRVKKLFDPEREAAIDAIQTGVYIGWRCPEFKHDCLRVCKSSKCFCGHLLSDHAQYTGKSVMVPCTVSRCECKAFAFVPSRPEEAGEFWLQRRPGYDPSTWRAKCKCKHTHEEHHPTGLRTCRTRGCGCSKFFSNFLCAACDRHWEDHETSFETADMRKDLGLPYGEAYLPFHEFPELRNVVLTGREDDDSQFQALTSGPYAIPDNSPTDLALRLRGANTQNDSFKWKGTSPVDLQGLTNKTLDIDVTVYSNSDVAVCVKCYKSSVKYRKAEEHVQEIKTELKTPYSESGSRVKRLQCTEDELTPGTSAKKHLSFLNENPTTCSSSNLTPLSSAFPRLTISPIGKPQSCLFGNGAFSLVRSD